MAGAPPGSESDVARQGEPHRAHVMQELSVVRVDQKSGSSKPAASPGRTYDLKPRRAPSYLVSRRSGWMRDREVPWLARSSIGEGHHENHCPFSSGAGACAEAHSLTRWQDDGSAAAPTVLLGPRLRDARRAMQAAGATSSSRSRRADEIITECRSLTVHCTGYTLAGNRKGVLKANSAREPASGTTTDCVGRCTHSCEAWTARRWLHPGPPPARIAIFGTPAHCNDSGGGAQP